MKRVAVALVSISALAALAGAASRGAHTATGSAVCEEMTPAKMLENPALAEQYAEALRSGDTAEVQRVEALFADIRAVHGCEPGATLPRGTPDHALPPGHPPIGGSQRDAPSVPATPEFPGFQPPATVTI